MSSNKTFRVIICGSRDWENYDLVEEVVRDLVDEHKDELVIMQGGARGADLFAKQAAKKLGVVKEEEKANWSQFHKAAGPIRNQVMLDKGADLVIGFSNDIKNSKGTADMLRRARKAGVETICISEDSGRLFH